LPDGRYILGVHIADVSHYVRPENFIDKEAMLRGNSVYLVDRVIPMLPEKLSADICSLHENKDRLTLSFIAEIDTDGKISNPKFKETVIRSKASLNYDDVQAFLDGTGNAKIDKAKSKALKAMFEISRVVREKRLKKGSLDFDLPEPHVFLDPEGRVLDIVSKRRKPSHEIVEEFMLLANKYAAIYLQGLRAPILYRVHGKPKKEKVEILAGLLKEVGLKFSFKGEVTPIKIQRVLASVRGKPEEQFIEEIVLRTLAKAAYQPENIGHFGLAFETYTHFTSPIRRYPDLLTHRVLKLILNNKLNTVVAAEMEINLKSVGDHCTTTEIAAAEAERESVKIKKLEYLSERVGGVYDGIISGVIKAGIFVELVGSMVEGMIPFGAMEDDYFELEEGLHRARGRKSKKVFRLGDKVRVVVVRVDMSERRCDFALVRPPKVRKKSARRKK
ncbi:MAG: VacB/RNase II family 3'-5' exoribonuclease, partial [candidate division Zixibacteria bacterium]